MSRRRDTTYNPAPYGGDGLEVVANLSSETAPMAVLVAVAKWHERRKDSRNRIIASKLRELVDIQKYPYRTKLYAAAPAKQEG